MGGCGERVGRASGVFGVRVWSSPEGRAVRLQKTLVHFYDEPTGRTAGRPVERPTVPALGLE
jgi:hypothetical protein